MNLLAIDTARGEGSLALLRGRSRIDAMPLGTGPRYGEVLFGAIERLLSDCSLRLGDLDAFAVATGPGSFTGIRVGLGAAKALAEANGRPLVGVSSLRALASSCRGPSPRAALLDARRGELFAGCYGEDLHPVVPEMLGRWEDLAPLLEGVEPVLVGNEVEIFEAGGPAEAAAGWPREPGPRSLAVPVANVARIDIESGLGRSPESVEANYIRRASANLPPLQAASR